VSSAAEYWKRRRGFILAAIGSAIGLGNIWRFSWLCYRNGGGAFLVPYIIFLLIFGIPLLVLEFMLGHYFSGSSPKVFRKIKESLEPLGWLATINVFIIGTYYSVVLAWAMDYIGYSAVVAWKTVEGVGPTFDSMISNPAIVIVGLIITWLIVWITNFTGVASGIERACTYAIPLLWILSAVLVIRGLTLPGSDIGINWLLTPSAQAFSGSALIDAAGQILFTLSVFASTMIAYASYLPPKSEIPNSAWITAFANCGFSFFFAFATWGIVGYLMHIMNVATPADLPVPLAGAGLAFVTIPTGVTLLPGAPFTTAVFGTLFFIVLWLAGYTSLISIVEPVYTALKDKFGIPRKKAVSGIVAFSFIISILFAVRPDLIDPVDFMAGSTNGIWLVLLEAILAGYFLGMKLLRDYVNPNAEWKLGPWFDVFIKFISPIVLLVILGWGLATTAHVSPISVLTIVVMIIAALILSGFKWRTKEVK